MTEEILFTLDVDGPLPASRPHRASLGFALIAGLAWLAIVPAGRLIRTLHRLADSWGRETLVLGLIAWIALIVAVAWIIPGTGR